MSPKALRQFAIVYWPILWGFINNIWCLKTTQHRWMTSSVNSHGKSWSRSGNNTFYTSTLVLMRHLMSSTAQPQSSLTWFSVLTLMSAFQHTPSPSPLWRYVSVFSAPSVRLRQVDVLCNPQLSTCVSVCMCSRWTCARQVCVVLLGRCFLWRQSLCCWSKPTARNAQNCLFLNFCSTTHQVLVSINQILTDWLSSDWQGVIKKNKKNPACTL